MKDSILPTTAALAIDFGYVQGAYRRSEAMRSSEVDPVEPPTMGELEEALGEAVEKCDLLAKNWRNRVYRIERARGGFVLGKQLVKGTDAMLRYQWDESPDSNWHGRRASARFPSRWSSVTWPWRHGAYPLGKKKSSNRRLKSSPLRKCE